MSVLAVTYDNVAAAAQRLRGLAYTTPVLHSSVLNEQLGAEIFFKCENLQYTGAFKFRGAYNAISQLNSASYSHGVLAYSSGNHAQAVALVGKLLGIATTIVMPNDAPRIKRAATLSHGARIIDYDPAKQTRETIAAELEQQGNYALVKPFDDPRVIAGQGTAAVEFLQQVEGLEQLLMPCGGGGLLSGSAIATKYISPACKVIGIEPEQANDASISFRTGRRHHLANPQTIADGVRTPMLGELTFPLIQHYVDDIQTVSEAAIADAVRWLFNYTKLVVEPSGALGLAALLSGRVVAKGKLGIILSGGNVDPECYAEFLKQAPS